MGPVERSDAPRAGETVKVSIKDVYKIRRVYRRLAKMRGRRHLQRLTVYITAGCTITDPSTPSMDAFF
jgi:KaiC/GvpD/RAD55 family RecA-like ATPase